MALSLSNKLTRPSPDERHSPQKGPIGRSARILPVEDESTPALDVARRLRRLGYQILAVASSSPQAIEYALTCALDLVPLDIYLQAEE